MNVPLADLQSAANYFEEQTYPIEHQMFGWEIPPGIDGDRRVTIPMRLGTDSLNVAVAAGMRLTAVAALVAAQPLASWTVTT